MAIAVQSFQLLFNSQVVNGNSHEAHVVLHANECKCMQSDVHAIECKSMHMQICCCPFICMQEAFSPCCGEVALDTECSIATFLPAAVKYANQNVHGGLSISISVKASTAEEKQVRL